MDNTRDKLDRLIDGALADYSDAEPLAGLEARVVSRVRVAGAGRRRMFAWGLGFAVAASVVVVGILIWNGQRVALKPTVASGVAHVEPPPAVSIKGAIRVRPAARSRHSRALPKLDQFPAPTPLTPEERALITLVQRHPRDAEIFAELQKQADKPVEIERIRIAPLQSEGAQ